MHLRGGAGVNPKQAGVGTTSPAPSAAAARAEQPPSPVYPHRPTLAKRASSAPHAGTTATETMSAAATSGPPAGFADPPPPAGPAGASGSMSAAVRSNDPCSITSFSRTPVYSGAQLIGYDLQLCWMGGTAPYTVVSSPNATFAPPITTVAAAATTTCAATLVKATDQGAFLNVVDPSVAGPAVGAIGYNPIPGPTTPSVSPTVAWWGDQVTFTAQNLDPIPEANAALMPFIAVKAVEMVPQGSLQPTGATFEIPEDARSFYSIIQAHGRSSGVGSYVQLSPKNVAPYTNIHAVSWSPVDGKLFVAADGVLDHFDLFTTDPGQDPNRFTDSTTYSYPYMSRVAENGSVLVIEGVSGVLTIERWACSGGTCTASPFAQTHDNSFADPITPIGIAVSPDGQVAYVADAASHTVIRIPAGAGPGSSQIVPGWGGRAFSFPSPCGIDVAPGGQVLVADSSGLGYTYQLTSATSSTADQQVPPPVHTIQVDRDLTGATGLIYYYTDNSAPAMTEAFNLNSFGNPTATEFDTGAIVTGLYNGLLDVGMNMFMWVYHMAPKRVITNSEGETIPFPSADQTADKHVTVYGEGWPGVPLMLYIGDPPDLAAYAPPDGWTEPSDPTPPVAPYFGNDNASPTGAYLSDGISMGNPILVTPGGNYSFAVDMVVPQGFAGDNFQVRIIKADPSGNPLQNRVTAYSTVYTSWKRVYAERDRMFRKGSLLLNGYTATSACGGGGNPLRVRRLLLALARRPAAARLPPPG